MVAGGTAVTLLVSILGEVFFDDFLVFLGALVDEGGGVRALRLGGIMLAEEL